MSELPLVYVIGDSISIGYTPHVAALLAGKARVEHNPGNGGDSSNVAGNLDDWLAALSPAVIHVNCGLHDIKVSRQTHAHQVPLEEYRANLPRIVDRLAATGATVIWAMSTPVIESRHTARKDFDRYNRDIDAANAAAGEVASAAGIAVDDLHAAATALGLDESLTEDGVHFTGPTYQSLSRTVADCIAALL